MDKFTTGTKVEQSDSKLQAKYDYIRNKFVKETTFFQRFADSLTQFFGSLWFLLFHIVWFVLWVVINLGLTPIKPFDPYPFGFLTLVVSLEAIFFSIIILISENREQQTSIFREELSLSLLKLIEEKLETIEKNMIVRDE